jgi:hypothetical protein
VADLTLPQSAILTVIDALPDGTIFDAALIAWLLQMPEAEVTRRARRTGGCRPPAECDGVGAPPPRLTDIIAAGV